MDKYHPPFLDNTFYHVFNHANGNEDIFREEDNYRFFLEKYQKHITPVADTFAYCLLKNHFHFLVRTSVSKNLQGFENLEGLDREKVSQAFSNFFNSYTKSFNKKYQRRGSLFIPNIKRIEVSGYDHRKRCTVYIHRNPIHHGFVDDIREWPHTSFFRIRNQSKSFVMVEESLSWFGNKGDFEKAHEQYPNERSAFD